MAMTSMLSDYLAELRRLVHDPLDVYWSSTDKTANINTAMRRRDADTGANRTLITYALTIGQERYTLSQLGNTSVFDVMGIYLLFNGLRILLYGRSFTGLSTQFRTWVPNQWTPFAMARYNPTTWYVAPTPSIAYQTEWDCCVIGTELVAPTDADALPYPFTDPVPFYAAHLCKYNMREYQEADAFMEKYWGSLRMIEGSHGDMLPTGYPIYGR